MPQAAPKIKAIVLHQGTREARFPVGPDEDPRPFIADMICDGFRASLWNNEAHLFTPEHFKVPIPHGAWTDGTEAGATAVPPKKTRGVGPVPVALRQVPPGLGPVPFVAKRYDNVVPLREAVALPGFTLETTGGEV